MTDRFTVRAVVIGLVLVVVVGLALMGALALDDHEIPEAITAATSGALGALGALLARTTIEDKPAGEYVPQHMAP